MNHEAVSPPFPDYPEFEYLRLEADSLTSSASVQDPSVRHPELARTRSALYVQHYIHDGSTESWEAMTGGQKDEDRMSYATFQQLNRLSHVAMPSVEDYQAVEYVNVIHDICKNPTIMEDLGLLPGEDSHDEGLRLLFSPEHTAVRQRYLPSYDTFTEQQKELIRGVSTVPLNFIRFVQSQASGGEIASIANIPKSVMFASIMHGIHDLGGAMGHKDETSSSTLDEPAATRLLDAAYALTVKGIEDKERQYAYASIRANRLGISPDPETGMLSDEALTKLTVADLLRCYSAKDFAAPQAAFDRLPLPLRQVWSLVHAFPLQFSEGSRYGEQQGTEYAPAFLRALGKSQDDLYLSLGYFAEIRLITDALHISEAAQQNAEDMPDSSPYTIVNFYDLARSFSKRAEEIKAARRILLRLSISNHTITPKLADAEDRWDGVYVQSLSHPDVYRLPDLS